MGRKDPTGRVFKKYTFFVAFGYRVWPSYFLEQGLNLCCWQWENRFLTTGLPGNPRELFL